MNKPVTFQTNFGRLNEVLEELHVHKNVSNTAVTAMKTALGASAKIVQKAGMANLSRAININGTQRYGAITTTKGKRKKVAFVHVDREKVKLLRSIKYYGIGAGKVKNVEGLGYMIKVNAMADFRLRWFESGTKPRYNKSKHLGEATNNGMGGRRYIPKRFLGKPRFVGQIRAEHFFFKALEETQAQVFNNMRQRLQEAFTKAVERRARRAANGNVR